MASLPRVPYPVDCEGHVSFVSLGTAGACSGGITFRDGQAHLPDAAGLGVDVDWDALKRHQAANTKS